MLKDPVSEIPVIIIEKEIMYKIIPKNILDYIEKIMKGDEAEENYDIQNYISKIRMVPFMSIGKENGMLVGIRLDKIKIQTEDIDVERKDVIAGIYDKKITKDNKYNALIGLNLLETEKRIISIQMLGKESDYIEFTTNIEKQCEYIVCEVHKER